MKAAIQALRQLQPAQIVRGSADGVAGNLRAAEAGGRRSGLRNHLEPFHGVGAKCEDFSHTTDEELRGLLARQRETVPETIDTALVEAVRQSLRKFTGSRQDYDPSWT